jgi:signal peptidase I
MNRDRSTSSTASRTGAGTLPAATSSLDIADGLVRINGAPLVEPYVRHRRAWNVPEVTLGPREYFVVGDNRGMREADHDFGRVDRSRIVGEVVF